MSLTSRCFSSWGLLALLAGCGDAPLLRNGVSEVVLDACETPRLPTTAPEVAPPFSPALLTPVSPVCGGSLMLSSPFRFLKADGTVDFIDDLDEVVWASAEQRGDMCRMQVSVVGEVRPKEEGDPIVAPAPRPVRLRLCAARFDVNLPLGGLEPPVLRRLDIFGANQTTPLLTTPLPLEVVVRGGSDSGCGADVDVDDFVARAVVTLDVPLRTLARASSQSVRGRVAVVVEVEPR